jgi:monoamine oxidase
MARTPLLSRLQQAASVAAESAARNLTTGEILAERAGRRLGRRDVLKLAGAAGLAAGAATFGARPASAAAGARPAAPAGSPRIVVVGAGLAGLTCALPAQAGGLHRDRLRGLQPDRGRCWTIRDTFAGGQIGEHGGELIDQGHTEIRQLARSWA